MSGLNGKMDPPFLPESAQPQSFHWWSVIWWNVRELLAEMRGLSKLQEQQQHLEHRVEELEGSVRSLSALLEAQSKKKGGK